MILNMLHLGNDWIRILMKQVLITLLFIIMTLILLILLIISDRYRNFWFKYEKLKKHYYFVLATRLVMIDNYEYSIKMFRQFTI